MKKEIFNERELLQQHTPLVSALVKQFAAAMPPVFSAEHLHGLGLIALLDAVRSYPPACQMKFETFAHIQIYGALIGEIRRAQNWFQSEGKKSNPIFA
jgi:DNA-directed RNA polymerase specialized sigma subunit